MEDRSRKSRPMESTRISGVCVRENSDATTENEQQENAVQNPHETQTAASETIDASDQSVNPNSTFTVQRSYPLKQELHALNLSMENRSRKSRPMESTRISGVCVRENSDATTENEQQEKAVQNPHETQTAASETIDASDQSVGLNTTFTVQRSNAMKQELHGLNRSIENRSRKSRPMESTRISGVCIRENSDATTENEQQENAVRQPHETQTAASQTIDVSVQSAGLNSTFTVQRSNPMKQELHCLNHRLISYMDRVKQHETLLMIAESERRAIQEQLEKTRAEHGKKVEMLRFELDEHVRQAVIAEEQQAHLEKKVQDLQEERKNLMVELGACRQREASLERALVSEKNEVRQARSQAAEFENKAARDRESRQKISDDLTRLKVEYAKLQEKMKIANMELTVQEIKVFEAEQRLQFTSDDVRKKLQEQRAQLEKLAMEKIEEMRRKHDAEVTRLKKEHQMDKQNTLLTYVSAEDHAKLDTKMRDCARRLEETETALKDREERLRDAEVRIALLTASHVKEVAKERRRYERLNKMLVEQEKKQKGIQLELENYQKLIESLDFDENSMLNTPLGVKRSRASLSLASTSSSEEKISEAFLTEARAVLTRRVLTPVRKVPTTKSARDKQSDETDGSQHDQCEM